MWVTPPCYTLWLVMDVYPIKFPSPIKLSQIYVVAVSDQLKYGSKPTCVTMSCWVQCTHPSPSQFFVTIMSCWTQCRYSGPSQILRPCHVGPNAHIQSMSFGLSNMTNLDRLWVDHYIWACQNCMNMWPSHQSYDGAIIKLILLRDYVTINHVMVPMSFANV